jgi:hypothetical protein
VSSVVTFDPPVRPWQVRSASSFSSSAAARPGSGRARIVVGAAAGAATGGELAEANDEVEKKSTDTGPGDEVAATRWVAGEEGEHFPGATTGEIGPAASAARSSMTSRAAIRSEYVSLSEITVLRSQCFTIFAVYCPERNTLISCGPMPRRAREESDIKAGCR